MRRAGRALTGTLCVIPARIGSTRLPRKPLQPLLGKPLVLWVWERVRQMDFLDQCVVATDSVEVADVCRRAGADALLTSVDHPTGTDRAWEAVKTAGGHCEVIVNVQGDEPLIGADSVSAAIGMVWSGFEVGTCATPIEGLHEFRDPSVVKVVRTVSGRALYFSRGAIPHPWTDHQESSGLPHLRHLGVYAYRRDALKRWVRLGPSVLEREEGLEQLRALEHDMSIGVALVKESAGGVDTPEDLRRMEQHLRLLAGRNG